MLLRHFIAFFLAFAVSCAGEELSDGNDVDAYVQQQISDHDVMVFAKSYCPYCRRTKQLLTNLHGESGGAWSMSFVDLDTMGEDGPLIQMELLTRTGQKTVPNIFIDGKHIGGNSDLEHLNESGDLEELLSKISSKY